MIFKQKLEQKWNSEQILFSKYERLFLLNVWYGMRVSMRRIVRVCKGLSEKYIDIVVMGAGNIQIAHTIYDGQLCLRITRNDMCTRIYIYPDVQLQCRHLIPAPNAWAARVYCTTAHLIATQFPWYGIMDNLTTERSFESQATWVIDIVCFMFWTCYPWVFLQPGTGRRPVNCCSN